MAISANDLIELFRIALSEKWGYILGTSGDEWTQARQDSATDSMARQYGQKWVGRRVADCSGLFSWAFKKLGGYMYHGSNTMWKKYCTEKGKLSVNDIEPGCAVFKCRNDDDFYHVGLYIGNGTVIEARGTQYGVVTSKLSSWGYWGKMKGVEYGRGSEKMSVLYQAKVATANGNLNVRASAAIDAARITYLPKGTVVDVLETSGDWSRINHGSTDGWAMSCYLERISGESISSTHTVLVTDGDGNKYKMRFPVTIQEAD